MPSFVGLRIRGSESDAKGGSVPQFKNTIIALVKYLDVLDIYGFDFGINSLRRTTDEIV